MEIHPKRILKYSEIAVTTSTVITTLFFSFLSKQFLTISNIASILTIAAETGIVTIGMAFLIISGDFDLSVGSTYGLSALLFGKLLEINLNPILSLFIALIIASIIGFCNGIITLKTGISSFITTLGMMFAIRGVILAITYGFPVSYEKPSLILDILGGKLFGDIRISVIWFIITSLIFSIILNNTRYGNWVFATGGNKEVARAVGVNVFKVKIMNFTILGFLAGLAGCITFGRFRYADALLGSNLELEAIASSVIGGCYLSGGYGSIIGASLGAFLIAVIRSGLVIIGAPPLWYRAFVGIILVIAAIINSYIMKKSVLV